MKRKAIVTTIISYIVSTVLPFSIFSQATPKNDSPGASALLYEINRKDLSKPSYLYGTIHVICKADMFPMEKITPYFERTERLFLELDLNDPKVMDKTMSAFMLPDGKTLEDYLSPEKYAKVDEMFRNVTGVSVEMFKTMSPTSLSVIIGASSKSTGCLMPSSYEMAFVEMAVKRNLTIGGLETVEEQMAAIAKIPLEKQAEDLYKLTLEPQKPVAQFKELLSIYKQQDAEKLVEFIVQESAENPELIKNLLNQRNKNWIPRITKALAEKPAFIAVGSGHLGGPNGLVNLLRKEGYTLTPIKF